MEVTKTYLPLLQTKLSATNEFPIVINISSTLGSINSAKMGKKNWFESTTYQCSKAAINMLTKCQASASPSVKFVAINPGWVSYLFYFKNSKRFFIGKNYMKTKFCYHIPIEE